jgi:hypothetical protein
MSIRIQRNENANAITFVGSSQPAYWNNCLEGEVNETDATRVNVVNTVRTVDSDSKVYEFFAVPFTEFRTALGTAFNTAQECADYITAQANATAIGIIEFGATDVVDFQRDATNTTILASTGQSYPVNSVKAVGEADGTITIKENVDDGSDLMRFVRRTNVTFGGQTQAQQLNPVVNALNSLFTVTPVGGGAEDRFVSNTYTSGTPAVTAFGDVTINANVATKGTNTSSEFNDGFFTSSGPISANGEYFQFDNSGNDPLKKMMIGLMLTSEVSVAALEDNTVTGEDMDLAVRLKPNATYEHSPYGAVIENGMFTNPQRSDEYRAGIDNEGRLFISHYNDNASEWQVIVRSALVTADAEEYSLVVFLKEENAACSTLVTCKEIYDGPLMTYHYIESPDGAFYYPLFSTEEEANQLDTDNGGSGTNHAHVFADETPTSQTWFMPDTGGTMAGSSAPSNTADITYNVITTGADVNYAPTAYGTQTLTVNEGDAVNFAIDPAGADWTTTINGNPPVNFTLSGGNLVGTAPEVSGIIADNASDDYVITVTRTNVFGTSTGTLTLTVNNLTQTITAISGFTHKPETITMVDSDTLEAGSVVTIDDSLEQGKRMVFSGAFIRGLFEDISNSGSAHSVLIGVLKTGLYGSQWTNHSSQNIQLGWRLHKESGNQYLSVIYNGDVISSTNFGVPSFTRDLVMFHDTASNKLHMTHHGVTGGTGETMDTPTVISNLHMTPGSSDVDVTVGLSIGSSTDVDITTTGITEVNNPFVPSNLTSWTKALDFSGSNEYAVPVSSSNLMQPLMMGGTSLTASANADSSKTSSDTNSRPWATTMVFKADRNNSNQHIWNSGEGAGTGDDNIYLRLTAAGSLMFGWGREGTGYNECRIANQSISSSNWYGVYIAHKGARLSASNATAANLSEQFDIRLMSSADSFTNLGSNLSTFDKWTSTGARMDRAVGGNLTIGSRGGNRNFHGKIASMVTTTLKTNYTMPTDTEIDKMITDPMWWMDDYKIGVNETFRRPNNSGTTTNFGVGAGNGTYSYTSTQVWLMGDGGQDSYANGIRSEVLNTDQNYVKLQLNSMVSNDIETVTIPGLS